MAKKGGASEINGFVSVKNEDPKPTTKKTVSSRSVSEGVKKTSQNPKKPGQTDPANSQKLRKNDPKSTTTSSQLRSNIRTENPSEKGKVLVRKDGVGARLQKPEVRQKVVPSRNPVKNIIPGVSNLPGKTKIVEKSSKAIPATRKTADRGEKLGVNSKTSSSNREKKDLTEQKKTNSTVNSKKVVAKTNSIESSRKPQDPKNSTGTEKRLSSRSTGNSSNAKSVVNLSEKKSSYSKRVNDTTKVKITSKEKTSITVQEAEPDLSKNEEIPSEIKITDNYKDLIYFEIDMGTKKEKKEPVNKQEAELIPTPTAPPPISRQGTFTKDDEDSVGDSTSLPVVQQPSEPFQPSESEDYDYEDDFEDYESDFEEYVSESGVSSDSESDMSKAPQPSKTSADKSKNVLKSGEKTVEEEKKLDSGSYDLSSKTVSFVLPQSVKQKQLDQIREAISKENTSHSERNKDASRPLTANSRREAIDFVAAFEKQGAEKAKKQKKNRSTLILEKIKLHEQQISIFEAEFFHWEALDMMYKGRDVAHASCEAALLMRSGEMQTDHIKMEDKWVQYPPELHRWGETDESDPILGYLEDRRGFGGDNASVDLNSWLNPYYNPEKLYNFVDSAGQVMLILLEEEERWKSERNISVTKAKNDHGFSRGFIPIQTWNLEFLKNRPICDIVFSPHNENIFLSSHRSIKNPENLPSFEDQFMGRSILCLWNILEPSQPLSIFVASCQLSSVAFDIVHINIIYGGLTDGSICLWDTNERSIYHKETIAGSLDYLLRTPSFCSAYLLSEDLHTNVIVSILSVGSGFKGNSSTSKFVPTEILTLDSDGKIILWVTVMTASCLDNDFSLDKEDFGQTFWSRYKLVASRTVNPSSHLPSSQNSLSLLFLCLSLAPQPSSGVLVGTNNGSVVHCLISEEKPAIPVFSNKEETDCFTSVHAIERSPQNLPVFLAGCSNGTIRVHLMERKRPIRILMMENQMAVSPITKIRWSSNGAGHFFAFDRNLCLHLWDLCKTEASPLISVPLKKMKATHFDISADKKFIYVALVVHKEKVEIHRLKEQFSPGDVVGQEKIFMSFVEKCCY